MKLSVTDLRVILIKKTSAFYDLVGSQVASDQITIVDDGTINEKGGLCQLMKLALPNAPHL